jgi:solute carrier family 35 protein F1/2
VLILSDALDVAGGIGGDEPAGPQRWKGDMLCLAGASLYAVSNVAQEASIKGGDRVEFLGMLGVFGTAINGAQLLVLELGTLREIQWTGSIVGLIIGFALCLFAMYILTSHFLTEGDATLFNLSMLTSDLWAVLVGVLLFGQGLSWLYFIALAILVSGIVLYNSAELKQTIPAPRGAGEEGEGGGYHHQHDSALSATAAAPGEQSTAVVISAPRSASGSQEQQALLE